MNSPPDIPQFTHPHDICSKWIGVSAIFLALAVCLGAFGAHGLRERLDAYSMSVYEKAVFYHFIHALGLLCVSIISSLHLCSSAGASRVSWALALGIVIFSGSLYALAITGVRWLGAITPIGGLAFIIAWLMLAADVLWQSRS